MSEYSPLETSEDFPTEAELQQALARLEAADYPRDLLLGPSRRDITAFVELRTMADEEAERLLAGTGLTFESPATGGPKRFLQRTLQEMLEQGEDPDSVLDLLKALTDPED